MKVFSKVKGILFMGIAFFVMIKVGNAQCVNAPSGLVSWWAAENNPERQFRSK